MLIVGERINSSLSSVAEAIVARDQSFLQHLARQQAEAGAHFLEVNAASAPGEEAANLEWLVQTVQEAVTQPLCLDSTNPAALEAGLSCHRGRAIVNSITGELWRVEGILPLVKKFRCQVVGMVVGPRGVPLGAAGRVSVARRLVSALKSYGLPLEDLYLDPAVMPLSVDDGAATTVLEALRDIKSALGVKVILGLSNISFGLPRRLLLNRTFLPMAMTLGLDAAILDPLDRELMATIIAAQALRAQDPSCAAYLAAYRQGRLNPPWPKPR